MKIKKITEEQIAEARKKKEFRRGYHWVAASILKESSTKYVEECMKDADADVDSPYFDAGAREALADFKRLIEKLKGEL